MMNIRGQTVPVSVLSIYIEDSTYRKLETLTKILKSPNNKDTIHFLIEHTLKEILEAQEERGKEDDKKQAKSRANKSKK